MSYDLAVWEGDAPVSDAAAQAHYERLMAEMEANFQAPPPPTARIEAYVAALLQRWPDISDADDDSPWATAPLLGEAFGGAIYFPMVWSRAEEASDFAARVAEEHGLVCFDPQTQQLGPTPRPAAGRPGWLRRLRSDRR